MSKGNLSDETKAKIDEFLSELHLNVMGTPGTTKTPLTEEYIVRLITKFAVSLATVWWSITEILAYVRTRKTFVDMKSKLS